MTNTYVPKPAFDFGRVMNRTFRPILENWQTFTLAALFIIGLPYFLVNLIPVFMGVYSEGLFDGIAGENPEFSMGPFLILMAIGFLSALVIFVGTFILQGAIVHACVRSYNHKPVIFTESLRVAVRYVLPIMGFAILSALGIMAGALLFIVPGIILAMMWAVGVPVLICENTKVMDSFGRSAALTKGYKWWIFLVVIVVAVIGSVLSAVITAIAALGGIPTQEEIMLGGAGTISLIFFALASGIAQALASLISATSAAAIYYELRVLKEGIGADALAAVFD